MVQIYSRIYAQSLEQFFEELTSRCVRCNVKVTYPVTGKIYSSLLDSNIVSQARYCLESTIFMQDAASPDIAT